MTTYRTIEVDGTETFWLRTAHAYLQDLPEAELHLLDTGHFATATYSKESAELVGAFLSRHGAHGKTAGGGATKA